MRPNAMLVQTKLGIRRPRTGSIARPDLLAALDDVLAFRLALVSAPPGFGKTTLVTQWLTDRAIRSGWLGLDVGDNDPTRFCRYLLAAAQPVLKHDGEWVRHVLAQSQLSPSEAVASLVNGLATGSEDVAIVLDDYHVISADPVHALVTDLIDHLPAHAHLVLLTRADPPLPLSRLRACGDLLEIRAERLRFSADEAAAFLNGTMGLRLSSLETADLAQRTEGWPAGLQLAALALHGRSDPANFIARFSGSHRFVLDYLLDEVLERQPAPVKDFLLATGILDRLCPELCDAVTATTGAQDMLHQLERMNLFLIALDDRQEWFRFHRLFLDLLRARLHALRPADVPILHGRSARWHNAHGLADEAIGHALAAGDLSFAIDVIERHWIPRGHAGELDTVIRWLDSVPDDVVRANAQLSAAYGFMLALKGDTDGLARRVNDAASARHRPDAPPPAPGDTVPAQIATLRASLARRQGDPVEAIHQAELALAAIPADAPAWLAAVLRADINFGLMHAHRDRGDSARAAEAARVTLDLMWAAGNYIGAGLTGSFLGRLETARGRAAEATASCMEVLERAAEADLLDLPAFADVHVALAEARLARGEREAAETEVRRGLLLARRGGASSVATAGEALLARLTQAESPTAPRPGGPLEPLTDREREVLVLLAAGRSNRQIADELVVALGTVKFHVHSICGKLAAQSRLHAVARARELGLLERLAASNPKN